MKGTIALVLLIVTVLGMWAYSAIEAFGQEKQCGYEMVNGEKFEFCRVDPPECFDLSKLPGTPDEFAKQRNMERSASFVRYKGGVAVTLHVFKNSVSYEWWQKVHTESKVCLILEGYKTI